MTTKADNDLVEAMWAMFRGTSKDIRNPYPLYALMREQAPVLQVGDVVAVSRYEDVVACLKDPVAYSSTRMSGTRYRNLRTRVPAEQLTMLDDLVGNEGRMMNQVDAPDHTRLRALANFAFTPRRIAAMTTHITELVDGLLDDAVEAATDGAIDVVEALAYPLPYLVITGMLGASPERAEDVRTWSAEIGKAIGTDYSNVPEAHAALQSFRAYLRELVEERRQVPRDDLLGSLVSAEHEGGHFATDELEAMFVLLLFAGHETTTNLIGNAIRALGEHPGQREVLLSEGAERRAVEEFLRYCNSVHFIHRTATRDCTIAGVNVLPGQTVRLMIASANHDPEVFDRPDELDLDRPREQRHMGFGHGVHTCLGAWLARLEVQLAVQRVVARYPDYRLVGDVEMRPNLMLSGPERLVLHLG